MLSRRNMRISFWQSTFIYSYILKSVKYDIYHKSVRWRLVERMKITLHFHNTKLQLVYVYIYIYTYIYIHIVMNTTILQLVAIYKIQLHVSALYVGHHQVVQRTYLLHSMCGNFGWGTRSRLTSQIVDQQKFYVVKRDLVHLPKLQYVLCSQ